jgi:rRNA maturation RNase YbeY
MVASLFKKEKVSLSRLDYVFCSDEFLLEINNKFLNHDYYTDIITFDLSDTDSIMGEIYISIDRVKDNATQQSTSFKEELTRVIFHGALHLCGYKDKKQSEINLMRQKENYYLNLFHVKQS